MAHASLGIVFLLICSLPAGAVQTWLPRVEVRLILPREKGGDASEAVRVTELPVRMLLGGSVRRAEVDEAGRPAVVWSAPSWNPAIAPERLEDIRRQLKARWGEAIRFGVPPQDGVASWLGELQTPGRSIAAENSKLIAGLSLLPSGLDRGFDARRDRAAGTSAPPAAAGVFAGGARRGGAGLEAPAAQLPLDFTLRSVPPPEPLPYDAAIRAAAANAGLDPAVLRALVSAKSRFNPELRGGGGYGLTMVSPGAAADVGMKGADLMDPETNLKAGALYLARMLKAFRGDLHRALAAYQAGPRAVFRSGGIPNRDDVRLFLAAYERALRSPEQGPKPRVKPVAPSRAPVVTMAADAVASLAVGDPKDPTARYRPLVEAAAARYGMDPDLVMAIMKRENPWGDPKRVSKTGAVGVMQLMPRTAAGLGVDPSLPEQAIPGAVRHLKWLFDRFDGNEVKAVAAYNSGHVPVQKLGRVPNIRQTVTYVAEVFGHYEDLTGRKVDYAEFLTPRARLWAAGGSAD